MSKKVLIGQCLHETLLKSQSLIESYRLEMSLLHYKLRCCRLRNVGVRIGDLTTEGLQNMVDDAFVKIKEYCDQVKDFQKYICINLNITSPTSPIDAPTLKIAKKLVKSIKEFNRDLKKKVAEGKGLRKHMDKLARDYY